MDVPMKTIRISDATNREIMNAATGRFRQTAKRLLGGDWLVPVDDEVHQLIEDNRLPGESDDDVVMRVIHKYFGRPYN